MRTSQTIEPRAARATLIALLLGAAACGPAGPGDGGPQAGLVASGREIVVTDHPLATSAAAAVLEAGGNAVDASIAAAFALAVVLPEAGNLGGGGFMLVSTANGETVMIDHRETAPAAATAGMFLDAGGNPDPELSLASGLASGVPGSVAGLEHAHRRFGTRPWRSLLAPAIELAARGFTVGARLDTLLRENLAELQRWPETRRTFLRGGDRPYRKGETLVQPELARSLRRIQAQGAAGFYRGEVAERLVREVAAAGGIMTLADLAAYRVVERAPVRGHYRDLEVIAAAPPSSGGAVLILMLHLAEQLDLGAFAPGDPRAQHLLIEIMRRAYALRSSEFGDPDFVDVPLARILDPDFARQLTAGIDRQSATPSATLLERFGYQGSTPEGANTTHLLVADRQGNVVALTTTLNANFGSKIAVTGAGFLLNNEMDDFTAKPGTPNLYGLIQGSKNRIAPGKRPLSSMTPAILLRDGRPVMTLGSPGGSRIINAVLQVILAQTEFGLDPVAAVRRPRLHHQFLPDQVFFERGALDAAAQAALAAAGHTLAPLDEAIGHVHLAVRGADGRWLGVADPRRGGAAWGR